MSYIQNEKTFDAVMNVLNGGLLFGMATGTAILDEVDITEYGEADEYYGLNDMAIEEDFDYDAEYDLDTASHRFYNPEFHVDLATTEVKSGVEQLAITIEATLDWNEYDDGSNVSIEKDISSLVKQGLGSFVTQCKKGFARGRTLGGIMCKGCKVDYDQELDGYKIRFNIYVIVAYSPAASASGITVGDVADLLTSIPGNYDYFGIYMDQVVEPLLAKGEEYPCKNFSKTFKVATSKIASGAAGYFGRASTVKFAIYAKPHQEVIDIEFSAHIPIDSKAFLGKQDINGYLDNLDVILAKIRKSHYSKIFDACSKIFKKGKRVGSFLIKDRELTGAGVNSSDTAVELGFYEHVFSIHLKLKE